MRLIMDIRSKIDMLREERGWSRSELAKKIGISYTALQNWYNEKDYFPSLKVIDEICHVFDITKARLFADIDTAELSGDQMELLDLYDKLTEKQKEGILQIIKAIVLV